MELGKHFVYFLLTEYHKTTIILEPVHKMSPICKYKIRKASVGTVVL